MKKSLIALAVLATLSTSAMADVYGGIAVGSRGDGSGEANVGFGIIETDTHSLNFEVTGSKVALKATQSMFGGTLQPATAGTPATVTGPGTPATPAQLVPNAANANGLTGAGSQVTYANKIGGALVFKGQVSESVSVVFKGGLQGYKTGNTNTSGIAGGLTGGTAGATGGFLGKALGENGIEPTVSVGADYRIPGMGGTAVTARVAFAPSQQESLNIGIQHSFR